MTTELINGIHGEDASVAFNFLFSGSAVLYRTGNYVFYRLKVM